MEKNLSKVTEIFKALSCETRLKIVLGLASKDECNVNTMAEKLGIPQPNVSQHLAVLKKAGIIAGFRNGTQICYKVIDEQTKEIIKSLKLG